MDENKIIIGETSTQENNYDNAIDDVLVQITSLAKKHQYTQQEIDEARDNLAFMNDRVFLVTFSDNKNNHIITATVNALRKIHTLAYIPPIERTTVQKVSLLDVLGRGMVGDLLGEGAQINIAVEVQKWAKDGYAVRGTLTSSNAMRIQFNTGDDFTEAPDVIGINILGFKLPELVKRKMFCSRIIRAEYESKEYFLADKYSDYYIELPKMDSWSKGELPKEYHDLWDLCCIFRAKTREYEEVIRMHAITNAAALELSKEVKKTVATNEFVNEALDRNNELLQLQEYFKRREQKAAQKAAQEATIEADKKAKEADKKAKEANKKAKEEIKKTKEEMIIIALQSNVPNMVIETMQKKAGITDARLAELRKQTQSA